LLRQKWADAAELAALRDKLARTIEEAVAQVQREPAPDPYADDWRALSSKNLVEGNE
jgi:TPP-dependent pyruvate/acetoin dehydrogenase alpha subunit